MSTKKKPKRNRARPETRISDSTFDVSDSTNTAMIFGDRNVVTQKAISQRIEMEADDDDDLTIRIGRWIMLKLFGTLKHGMKWYGLVSVSLGIAVGVPTVYSPLLIQTFGETNFIWVWGGFALLLAAILYFGWLIFVDSSSTTCPRCGWKFSWLRTKRVLTKHAELSDREVRNYESTYSCTNPSCGYKRENVREIIEITAP